jgi:TP901 family phage tail tape measure protein
MIRDAKRYAAIGATALAGGIALAVNEAVKFERAMDEVSTLLDDTSSIDGMKKSMAQLAVQFGSSQVAQTEALYQAISAGAAAGEEAINLLTAANKLAIGGVTDVKTSVDALTTVMNAYGDEAGTAADISDVFFTAVKAGKTTIPELASAIGNVATLAGQMGVTFEETAAAAATLTKSGLATTEAMTGIRGIMVAIAKPTEKAVKMAKELGIEFNSTALRSKGLAGFLDDVKKATGGNVDQMAKLFGRFRYNTGPDEKLYRCG